MIDKGQWREFLPGHWGYTPTLYEKCHGIFNDVTSVRTFIVLCVCCVRFFPVLSVSLTFTFLGCC